MSFQTRVSKTYTLHKENKNIPCAEFALVKDHVTRNRPIDCFLHVIAKVAKNTFMKTVFLHGLRRS